MNTYYVKFKDLARHTAAVEANTIEDAKKKAAQRYLREQYKCIKNIDDYIISIVDVNGMRVS